VGGSLVERSGTVRPAEHPTRNLPRYPGATDVPAYR
jgi:hypothetical protein